MVSLQKIQRDELNLKLGCLYSKCESLNDCYEANFLYLIRNKLVLTKLGWAKEKSTLFFH